MVIPTFSGIDHFHLYVANKDNAVHWYKKMLGFLPVDKLSVGIDDGSPLTIEDKSKSVRLALFTRQNQPPSTSIAFKVTGEAFLAWKEHLQKHGLKLRIADHQMTWSVYFKDPDDNMHEITTDEYQYVLQRIEPAF